VEGALWQIWPPEDAGGHGDRPQHRAVVLPPIGTCCPRPVQPALRVRGAFG
jgi:hypothetical protein